MTQIEKLHLQHFKRTGRLLPSPKFSRSFADPEPIPVIDDATLQQAFDLPPEKAIEFLRKKGYNVTWSYLEMKKEAHDQAFTVAKAMSADVLQTIRAELNKAMEDGIPLEKFKKELTPKLEKLGWIGKKEVLNPNTGETETVELGTARRLKIIYETNLQSAFMNARWSQIVDSGTKYIRFFNQDPKTDTCIGINGKVFRSDDPGIRITPLHWDCKTSVGPISDLKFERDKMTVTDASFFKGKVDPSFDGPPGTKWEPDTGKYDDDIGSKLKQALDSNKPSK